MIRTCRNNDIAELMRIWLDVNVKAHNFIPEQYWVSHFDLVKGMLPQARLYVYEDERTGEIEGFTGLMDDYIAGIFVREQAQSKGIGKQLLDALKSIRSGLTLHVYQKNKRAVSFYQREAFAIQSERQDEGTGEMEFVMVWRGDGLCSLDL